MSNKIHAYLFIGRDISLRPVTIRYTLSVNTRSTIRYMRTAIIGTYPPRQCGIATFTHDLFQSIAHASTHRHGIIAISDGTEKLFPEEVDFVIERNNPKCYITAARYINDNYDACIIQHEYGIFGGTAGDYILHLAKSLHIPLVSNLHTVLENPTVDEKNVLQQLTQLSHKVTVMTKRAITMLQDIYDVTEDKVRLIPHGVPDFSYDQQRAKKSLGYSDKKIMLSFGFLGRNKGFETAIEAVASVRADNFIYLILGSTHPNILREEGESYREELIQKTRELGISDKVKFINCFASETLLKQYLSACDIYVTPYPNEQQISSGTLSFAIGAGAAVISTPYWYANDLLAENRGLFFDFKNANQLAGLINQLLENPTMLAKYRNNAAEYGRKMCWTNIGRLQLALLESLKQEEKSFPVNLNIITGNVEKNISPISSVIHKKLYS